jgi:hypothetical protein
MEKGRQLLLFVHGGFQLGARREANNFFGGNLDWRASLGIAASSGLAGSHGKCPESDQGHSATFLELGGDGVHQGIHGRIRLGFGDAHIFCYSFNQISFVHGLPSFDELSGKMWLTVAAQYIQKENPPVKPFSKEYSFFFGGGCFMQGCDGA